MDSWFRETGLKRLPKTQLFFAPNAQIFEPNAQVVKMGKAKVDQKWAQMSKSSPKVARNSQKCALFDTFKMATCAFGAMWMAGIWYLREAKKSK